jgi:hypothetical protein
MVHAAAQRALRGGSFFVAPPRQLRIEHVADETVRWETFRGQLLDPAHTRQEERFAAWHVFLDEVAPAAAPLVSIRWQRDQNKVFVTRQILCRGFEAYEDAPGVILSRPVEKWVAELVGTVDAASTGDDALGRELGRLLFLAVVGISRLPITSLETPLPAFTLGRLAYVPTLSDATQPWSDPIEFLARAIATGRNVEQQAKALETALRAEPAQPTDRLANFLAETFAHTEGGVERLAGLFRAVFNGVALSPYTHFADSLIGLVLELADAEWFGPAKALDVLGYMLRNLCRHLTAFDLTLFHNFGANYPDALFLEALLKAYLKIAARRADLVFDSGRAERLRRRALRQASLVRRHYEGHLVPDAPTSMGESARVLPAPFTGVPEEQIFEAGKRRRKLFADKTTDELLGEFGLRLLAESLADLDQPRELRELGMAQFLDRPLGVLKEPGEVDRTPLLSYEAFSRSIARRRMKELAIARWIDDGRRDSLLAAIASLAITGVPVADLAPIERPGVVSIADAGKAAADFVLLRTTPGSLRGFWLYDWRPLIAVSPETHEWLVENDDVLLVQCVARERSERPVLRVYRGDDLRLEFGLPEGTQVYDERGGVELAPLQILRICDSSGERNLDAQSIWLKRYVGV